MSKHLTSTGEFKEAMSRQDGWVACVWSLVLSQAQHDYKKCSKSSLDYNSAKLFLKTFKKIK